MRPSKVRSDRQKQYNYLSDQEYQQQLQQQIQDKRREKEAEHLQNQAEIIDQYKNYQLGGTEEDQTYINDLEQLIARKEHEVHAQMATRGIAMRGGQAPQVFSGDMNVNTVPEVTRGAANLFADDFVRNYGKQNHENMNIVGNRPQSEAESERVRRLALRDIERQKRMQGGQSDGTFGGFPSGEQVQPPVGQQDNIFGGQGNRKREDIWEQKWAQKVEPTFQPVYSAEPTFQPAQPQFQPAQHSILPIHARELPEEVRSSRHVLTLQEARSLDKSLNLEPKASIIPGDNELIQKRRANEKAVRQQEYNDYLQKQRGPMNQYEPPTSAQSQQRPQNLLLGEQQQELVRRSDAFSKVGAYQMSQADEKVRKQREYKEYLDRQQMERGSEKNVRKQQIVDQVFNEVMSNSTPQKQNILPPRGFSAQQPRKVPAQQDNNSFFFGGQSTEDEKKKKDQEKRKQYAYELQQQMQNKADPIRDPNQRRMSARVDPPAYQPAPHQIPPRESQVLDQQFSYQAYQQNQGFDPYSYQVPGMQPSFQPQIQPQIQTQIQPQIQPQMIDNYHPGQAFAPQSSFRPSVGQGYQEPYQQQMSQPMSQPIQQPIQQPISQPYHEHPSQQTNPNQAASRASDYKRMLEEQIKQNEEKKKRDDQERLQRDHKEEADMKAYSNQVNQRDKTSFTRQRTDIRQMGDEDDHIKKTKQAQLQEELGKQMEDKKRQKDEEARKRKQEEEKEERRMQAERDALLEKEQRELVKEGKLDPSKIGQEKKKNVKRDLFETSEGNAVVGPAKARKFDQVSPVKEERYLENNVQQPMESQGFQGFVQPGNQVSLPINQRQEKFYQPEPYQPRNVNFDHPPQSQGVYPSEQLGYQQQPPASAGFGFRDPHAQVSQDIANQQKMVEEQQKMIMMYQKALEQIMEARNQYFQEVMQMRETLMKEKEQMRELDNQKRLEQMEQNQLRSVHSQLGNLINQVDHNKQPIMNPQLTSNLNNLLITQRNQLEHAQQEQQVLRQSMQQQRFELPVPKLGSNKMAPQFMDQNHVEPGQLEESMSGESKLVNVPQNKLTQIAQQPELFSTWKNNDANLHMSLAGHSSLVHNFQATPQKGINPNALLPGMSRPQTSQVPDTIQEVPEDGKQDLENTGKSFNPKLMNNMSVAEAKITDTNPLMNTGTLMHNVDEIERMVKMQQTMGDNSEDLRKKTQSEFFNKTMTEAKKMQEAKQHAELQNQLARIYGSIESKDIDDQLEREVPNFANPLKVAAISEQAKHGGGQQVAETDINIANSMTHDNAQDLMQIADQLKQQQRFTSNNFGHQDQQQIYEDDDFDEANQVQQTTEPVEISMSRPRVYKTTLRGGGSNEYEEDHDIWNDPDLVPPPIYEDDELSNNFVAMENSQYHMNQPSYIGGTVDNLDAFSPPVNDTSSQPFFVGEYEEVSPTKYDQFEGTSSKSLTKNEKDMMEINQLIKKATDTTNYLLENSDNHKFKIPSKQGTEQKEASFKSKPDSAKKVIRTVDVFGTLNKQTSQFSKCDEVQDGQEETAINGDNDDMILNNLDQMIFSLQEEQTKGNQSNFNLGQPEDDNEENEENKEEEVPPKRVGKFAQMALANHHADEEPEERPKSQTRLGRFAQMAAEGSVDADTIDQISHKYGNQGIEIEEKKRQTLLRPISSKSNSNRYQKAADDDM